MKTQMQKARAAVKSARMASRNILAACDMSADCEFRAAQFWVRDLELSIGLDDTRRILELAANRRATAR